MIGSRRLRWREFREPSLEDRLSADGEWVESLNFATAAHCTVQRLADLEMRILDFDPDVYCVICHGGEVERNLRSLAWVASEIGSDLTSPYLKDLFARAGVGPGNSQADIIRALSPYRDELMHWTYQRIARVCHEHGIAPVWIYLPNTRSPNPALAQEGRRFAAEAGLTTIVLDHAYGDLPLEDVTLNEADSRPNELGHRLVAKRLFEKFLEYREEIGLPEAPVFLGVSQKFSRVE